MKGDVCVLNQSLVVYLAGVVCLAGAMMGLSAAPPSLSAGEHESPKKIQKPAPKLKRTPSMKTLGGRQLWGDLLFFHGWRIQKNVLTGHYRLLDPQDFRHASGSRKLCQAKLEEIKRVQQFGPMSGKAVVLVHGIVRSSKSFDAIAKRLRDEGYVVIGFDYPSTRVKITDSAEFLHSVIESLNGIEEINFVVHSMGGIVTRTYLLRHRDKRIKRMVMSAVPNRGARMADRLRNNALYRIVFGPAGQQLGSDPNGFIAELPTPDFEFAVIAGGRNNLKGYNPLVPGDDDGTVSVSSTRLPGADDFLLVNCLHSFLMGHGEAIDATVRFLKSGRLREQGDSHPIPRSENSRSAQSR